jgi:hypothetical protein
MSTGATYAEVLTATRAQAAAWPRPVEVEYGFLRAVSDALGLDYEAMPRPEWDGFSRQVYRALTKLTEAGELFKGDHPRRRGAVWRTPEQYEQHEAARTAQAAERQAKRERGEAQAVRLAALGITADMKFGWPVLGPDQLDHLMDLAAKGLQ